jgi:hypothetical protein
MNEIKEIVLFASLKTPIAKCGEWQQGWKPPN